MGFQRSLNNALKKLKLEDPIFKKRHTIEQGLKRIYAFAKLTQEQKESVEAIRKAYEKELNELFEEHNKQIKKEQDAINLKYMEQEFEYLREHGY